MHMNYFYDQIYFLKNTDFLPIIKGCSQNLNSNTIREPSINYDIQKKKLEMQ